MASDNEKTASNSRSLGRGFTNIAKAAQCGKVWSEEWRVIGGSANAPPGTGERKQGLDLLLNIYPTYGIFLSVLDIYCSIANYFITQQF